MPKRTIGIDIGAETIKIAEVLETDGELRRGRQLIEEHHKEPRRTLLSMLADWDWDAIDGAAVTGRMRARVTS